MDKLETIFAMQQALDADIAQRRNLEFSMEQWLQKDAMALIVEVSELLDAVNYKWWKNPQPLNMEHIKEELVDVLHFYISMCCRAGMDANELFAVYSAKNQENFDRQQGKSTKAGYEASAIGG
ncbi:MAG: dUTPase [Christensenellaceae bacterium]|jgi:dimeric dUTPase (all-alpha-NTP-PPase superfamily)|nr:dUTPase [Christensenellaceae bacterium]